jgi:hypothetical protein
MSTIFDRLLGPGRAPNRAERAAHAQADIAAYEQEEHAKWGAFLSHLEGEQMTATSTELARQRPTLLVPAEEEAEG